jgi:hypothetical protein
VRFCPDCQKNVYNLSAMTTAEAEAFLGSAADAPCVRFRRGADGTVITADGTGNRVARAWRRFSGLVGALLVGLASLTGCDCSRLGICTQGKLSPPPGTATNRPPAAAEPAEDEGDF